jgi:hypothetical protein
LGRASCPRTGGPVIMFNGYKKYWTSHLSQVFLVHGTGPIWAVCVKHPYPTSKQGSMLRLKFFHKNESILT